MWLSALTSCCHREVWEHVQIYANPISGAHCYCSNREPTSYASKRLKRKNRKSVTIEEQEHIVRIGDDRSTKRRQ
ncbi:hypothetical protein M514_28342 [Trichuris suis]|uniref:Uncharacterized protein n=1 Tax=Trichuris suis TaxID=68888 RepID=A0A085MQI3_9BILA|nr:hypothetical protein M514_28342 [Trichuris suis]